MTCGSLGDVLRGRARWTLPPAGLAPDGAVRVRLRVRGGKTIDARVRNSFSRAKQGYASIAPPRWIDADGREFRSVPQRSDPE